ncbi:MAG TPA: hypothetical protein VGN57_09620 [Pirellulaceae bacterium]|nr:hypothetical protein [Pirellulaceae bacterium]
MSRWKPDRAAQVIIGNVLYEIHPDDVARSDRSIRRRLRYRGFSYDPGQVEQLRRVKDWLKEEIGLFGRSRYFLGSKNGTYASAEDFDVPRMVADCRAAFPDVPLADIEEIALYVYWER